MSASLSFDTEVIAPSERASEYFEFLSQNVTPANFASVPAGGPFTGRIKQFRCKQFRVTVLNASSFGKGAVAPDLVNWGRRIAIVALQRGRGVYNFASGRRLQIEPGAIMLGRNDESYEFDACQDEISMVSISFDTAAALSMAPQLAHIPNLSICSKSGVGRLISAEIFTLGEELERLPDSVIHHVAASCLQKAAFLLEEGRSAANRRSNLKLLLNVQAFMLENLSSDLSAGKVAQQFGISRGYLHQLFHDSGDTFGGWMRRQRLDRAKSALLSPLQRHKTITQIALECGFSDSAHFSRLFSQAYGASPKKCRDALTGH